MSTSFDLSRDQVIRNAYQLCGLLPAGSEPSANQTAMATDFLNLVLKDMQNHGIMLRKVTRTTVPLVYGQAQYNLSSNVLDVDQGTPYVTTNDGIDLQLIVISRGMYMALTNKATISQPTQIYIERGNPVSFFLYPTPGAYWTSVTLPEVVLLDDMSSGSVTTGLQAKYLKAIVFGLAEMIAWAHPPLLQRATAFGANYRSLLDITVNDDDEKGNLRFLPDFGNGSGW